jgi:hypothetical protein
VGWNEIKSVIQKERNNPLKYLLLASHILIIIFLTVLFVVYL